MNNTEKKPKKEQASYNFTLDERIRKPNYDIPVLFYAFLSKEQRRTKELNHKLVRNGMGPFQVKEIAEDTIVIPMGEEHESVP